MVLINLLTAEIQPLIQKYDPFRPAIGGTGQNEILLNRSFSEFVTRHFRYKVVDYMETKSDFVGKIKKFLPDEKMDYYHGHINRMVILILYNCHLKVQVDQVIHGRCVLLLWTTNTEFIYKNRHIFDEKFGLLN